MIAEVPASLPSAPVEVSPRSLRCQIASALERSILTGEYPPGGRLIERELIARFRVSSIPIREALLDLEVRGLVVKVPNVGCRVVELSAADIQSITELRAELEPKVVEWAAQRITPEGMAALKAQWARLADAGARNDVSAFFHEDLEFHRSIWAIAANRFAAQALESAIGPLFAAGLMRGTQTGLLNLKKETAKHRRLLNALLKGDGPAAAQVLRDISSAFACHLHQADR